MDKDFAVYLTKEIKTVYVQIEYIIDKDGNVVNPKILRGGNDEVNDHILDVFESMPKWTPAIRQEKKVPIKLKADGCY